MLFGLFQLGLTFTFKNICWAAQATAFVNEEDFDWKVTNLPHCFSLSSCESIVVVAHPDNRQTHHFTHNRQCDIFSACPASTLDEQRQYNATVLALEASLSNALAKAGADLIFRLLKPRLKLLLDVAMRLSCLEGSRSIRCLGFTSTLRVPH